MKSGQERLDCALRVNVVNTLQGQLCADLSALRGVTLPVQLTGTLRSPDWRILWSQALAGAAAQQLQNRLDKRLGEAAAGAAEPGASAPPSPREALRRQLNDKLRALVKWARAPWPQNSPPRPTLTERKL